VDDLDAYSRRPILGAWQLGIHGGCGFGKRPADWGQQRFHRTPDFIERWMLIEFLEPARSFFHQPERTVWI
jgi:hypothetical protein